MKADHDQRVENYKLQGDGGISSPRNPHNARIMQPKVLRGGGGASRSFYNNESSSSNGHVQDSSDLDFDSPPDLPSPPPAQSGAPPPYQAAAAVTPVVRSSVLSRFLGQK
jgi:hypothetical protein